MSPVDGVLLPFDGVEGGSLESPRALVESRLDLGRLLVSQVELLLPLVGSGFSLVGNPVPRIGDPVSLIRDLITLAGNLLAPLDRGQVFREAVHPTGALLQVDFQLIQCAA